MNWIELLLCAVAAVLAAAAFCRAGGSASTEARETAREAALRQDFARLREVLEALPGRISDEMAGSPIREAVEAARGDIARLGEVLGDHGERMRDSQEAQMLAATESLRGALSGIPEALAPLASGMEGLQGEVAASRREAITAAQAAREDAKLVVAAVGKFEPALVAGSDRTASALRDLVAVAETNASSLREVLAALEGLRTAFAASGSDEGVREEVRGLSQAVSALPVRIAEEVAARPAPAPELEELAVAVRESGHLRGDVARQVADAVSRVGQELSESGRSTAADREAAAASLEQAARALAGAVDAVREAVAPLQGALSAHGEALAPLSAALSAARDRLEESAGTHRANQVEFAASVDVFGKAAQDLAGGLSAFAREGELGVTEDPRAVQKAQMDALDRILTGFSESLKALLAESDLRTREVLAEIAARLPGSGPAA